MATVKIFVHMLTMVSSLLTGMIAILLGREFSEKLGLFGVPWYLFSVAFFTLCIFTISKLFETVGNAVIPTLFQELLTLLSMIFLLGGFSLLFFRLFPHIEVMKLEERAKELKLLISALSERKDEPSRELVNNLRSELIDIEERIRRLRR